MPPRCVTEDGDPGLDAGPTLDLGQALGDPAEPTVTEAVHLVLRLQHGPRDRDRTFGDHDDRRVRHAGVAALQGVAHSPMSKGTSGISVMVARRRFPARTAM